VDLQALCGSLLHDAGSNAAGALNTLMITRDSCLLIAALVCF
jgi:hypothetical protein